MFQVVCAPLAWKERQMEHVYFIISLEQKLYSKIADLQMRNKGLVLKALRFGGCLLHSITIAKPD